MDTDLPSEKRVSSIRSHFNWSHHISNSVTEMINSNMINSLDSYCVRIRALEMIRSKFEILEALQLIYEHKHEN